MYRTSSLLVIIWTDSFGLACASIVMVRFNGLMEAVILWLFIHERLKVFSKFNLQLELLMLTVDRVK